MADLLHLLDKPEGWTSHDVIAWMRRVLGERRVGHAGTLDPFATGLLLVAEGRATALLHSLSLLPKRYLARARLGIATDTQDRTGVPIRTGHSIPARRDIELEVERLRGLTRQRPPLYSAVKVRGERLYKAARRGETVEAEERPIRVYEIRADLSCLPDVTLDLTVSRGTYVRTLAHDLGEGLGCGAHLTSLRRTESGPFSVERALGPSPSRETRAEDYRARAVRPADAVPHLPRAVLTEEEATGVRHGRAPRFGPERSVPGPLRVPIPPGEVAWPTVLLAPDGELLALAEVLPAAVRLLRVFP